MSLATAKSTVYHRFNVVLEAFHSKADKPWWITTITWLVNTAFTSTIMVIDSRKKAAAKSRCHKCTNTHMHVQPLCFTQPQASQETSSCRFMLMVLRKATLHYGYKRKRLPTFKAFMNIYKALFLQFISSFLAILRHLRQPTWTLVLLLLVE